MKKTTLLVTILILAGLVLVNLGFLFSVEIAQAGTKEEQVYWDYRVGIAKRAHEAFKKAAKELGWDYNEKFFKKSLDEFIERPAVVGGWWGQATVDSKTDSYLHLGLVFDFADKYRQEYLNKYCKSGGPYNRSYYFLFDTSMGQICAKFEYPTGLLYSNGNLTYLIKEAYFIEVNMFEHIDGYPPSQFKGKEYIEIFWKYFDVEGEEEEDFSQFCLPVEGSESRGGNLISPAKAAIYDDYSVITYVKGDVQIRLRGSDKWVMARRRTRLQIGDQVKTGKRGWAEVKFANSSIVRMRPLTWLSIPLENRKNEHKCILNLVVGKIWAKLKELYQRESFTIKVPTAITSIRGTEFGIAYDEETKQAEVIVKEGKVSVTDKDGKGEVILSENEYIMISEGELPKEQEIKPVSEIEKEDRWWEEKFKKGISLWLWIIIGLVLVIIGFVIKKILIKKGKT